MLVAAAPAEWVAAAEPTAEPTAETLGELAAAMAAQLQLYTNMRQMVNKNARCRR